MQIEEQKHTENITPCGARDSIWW